MPAYTGASCATNPTFASCPGPAAGAPPATWIRPAVGGSIPVIMLSSVVLPAPFGPTRPAMVPAGTRSEHSASAHLSPYRFPRPSVWIIASISCSPLRRRCVWLAPPRLAPPAGQDVRPRSRSRCVLWSTSLGHSCVPGCDALGGRECGPGLRDAGRAGNAGCTPASESQRHTGPPPVAGLCQLHAGEPGKGILDRGAQGGVTGEHFPGAGRASPEAAEPENGHCYPSRWCMSGSPARYEGLQRWASPEGAHLGGIF